MTSRSTAQLLQVATLGAECLALPALLWKPSRWVVGTVLCSFHVGQALVFGYPFYANMALVALTYLPLVPWIERRFGEAPEARTTQPEPEEEGSVVPSPSAEIGPVEPGAPAPTDGA